jgi:hypothetical protein
MDDLDREALALRKIEDEAAGGVGLGLGARGLWRTTAPATGCWARLTTCPDLRGPGPVAKDEIE